MPMTCDRQAVLTALRDGKRFVVTSHVNPDGDACGSLLATHLVLRALGKDSVMVLGGTADLPREFRFLGLAEHGLCRTAPDDTESRVLVAVDCADARRIAAQDLLTRAATSVNIDHHGTNERFAVVNLVDVQASATGEIVVGLARELGVSLDPQLARAIYTALVTDTGRFQYRNTSPSTLRLAADLLEAGADATEIASHIYDSYPLSRFSLQHIALDNMAMHDDGRVVTTFLSRADFASAGATEPDSEAIVEILRSIDGVEMSLFIRELPSERGGEYKGSLRSVAGGVDVSAIAKTFDGGGHPGAAGFDTALPPAEILPRVLAAYRSLRAATGSG